MNKVAKNNNMPGSLNTLAAERSGTISGKQSALDAAKTRTKAKDTSYEVDLSSQSKSRRAEQEKAYNIAKSTPDVRAQRVADLKAKIKNGTYEVDSGKIADGILKEAIRDHLASID